METAKIFSSTRTQHVSLKIHRVPNDYSFLVAPKHEDLTALAVSIQNGDSHIVSCAHGKLLQIANQIKRLQQEAQGVLEKANHDQELSHAACNFEKVPGKVYHLYK